MKQIQLGNLDKLLCRDELIHAQLQRQAFKGFREAPIQFNPTYKFDVKLPKSPKKLGHTLTVTNGNELLGYDTSKKMRIPSWTDRILYKSKKPFFGLLKFFDMQDQITAEIYKSAPDISTSDHKPVYGIFSVPFNF